MPAARRMKAKGCKPWMCLTSDGAGENTDALKTLPQICQHRNFNSALNQATELSPQEAAASGQRSGGDGEAQPGPHWCG